MDKQTDTNSMSHNFRFLMGKNEETFRTDAEDCFRHVVNNLRLFVCLFDVLRSAREFSVHIETLPLGEGLQYIHRLHVLGTCNL